VATKSNGYYFSQNVEDAINKYNKKSTKRKEKEKLFNEIIYPAFQKLAENLIYIYKFYYIDNNVKNLRDECVSYLVTVLSKYNPKRKTKAFSYFNVIVKNWLIAKATKHKKQVAEVDLDIGYITNLRDTNQIFYNMATSDYEKQHLNDEFYLSLLEALQGWKDKILGEQDEEEFLAVGTRKHQRSLYKVIAAIIYLFENAQLFQVFSKKGIYIYLRELTNLESSQIASSLKQIKKFYNRFKKRYLNED